MAGLAAPQPPAPSFLTILSGLAWTIVYAEGIRLGPRSDADLSD
jgi:hypothetical protein